MDGGGGSGGRRRRRDVDKGRCGGRKWPAWRRVIRWRWVGVGVGFVRRWWAIWAIRSVGVVWERVCGEMGGRGMSG